MKREGGGRGGEKVGETFTHSKENPASPTVLRHSLSEGKYE